MTQSGAACRSKASAFTCRVEYERVDEVMRHDVVTAVTWLSLLPGHSSIHHREQIILALRLTLLG